MMWDCGLRSIRYVVTAGGIIALHVGEVTQGPKISGDGEVPGDAEVPG